MRGPNGDKIRKYQIHWRQAEPCPQECLCCDPSTELVARQIKRFNGDVTKKWAVYVLECKWISEKGARTNAMHRFGPESSNAEWIRDASSARRSLYVGYSKKLFDQIMAHTSGTTFRFTSVYPPVRLLNVDWYSTIPKAKHEKAKIADWLEANLEGTYVYCRGEKLRFRDDPIY